MAEQKQQNQQQFGPQPPFCCLDIYALSISLFVSEVCIWQRASLVNIGTIFNKMFSRKQRERMEGKKSSFKDNIY